MMPGKQGSGVIGCDKVRSSAHIDKERSRARIPRIFYLREWNEARGVLRRINLEEGDLEFEGFIVRIPPHLLAPLSCLSTLIGEKVSIIRTDSMTHPLVVHGMQSSVQEYRCNGGCRESYSDTRYLEASDVARCSRYNQV